MRQHYGVVASLLFVFVFLATADFSDANFLTRFDLMTQMECSRTCMAEHCDRASIRYGKYCGLGYSGCFGEEPCDDADACCQIHDNCVGEHGMMNVTCHKHFKRCLKKVARSGNDGFSQECPYDLVLRTMLNAMDIAILLGDLGPKLYS